MRHENSVFHQLSKHIPWAVFDRAVAAQGADHRVRRLRTRDQFLALLYGQLSGAPSLRAIEDGLSSHQSRLYHAGLRPVSRSTLADANARRSWQVYQAVFDEMVRRARPGLRRKLRAELRLLDATKLRLGGLSRHWARFSEAHCAAKLHVVYDPGANLVMRAEITPDTVNDITPARAMPIEAGATYVFDLGYYSYAWWADLDAAGCRFVTRLKTHTWLRDTIERDAPAAAHIEADRIGHLRPRMGKGKPNPFRKAVREIVVTIDSGKRLRLLTNDLDAPAEEIADLYKARWQVELLFKWLKQNLRIRHFLGTGENAVRTQVYIALIAFLILRAAHAAQNQIANVQAFARLVRLNIMHRREIGTLKTPKHTPPKDHRQTRLALEQC